jgi:hypothetical protein
VAQELHDNALHCHISYPFLTSKNELAVSSKHHIAQSQQQGANPWTQYVGFQLEISNVWDLMCSNISFGLEMHLHTYGSYGPFSRLGAYAKNHILLLSL